MAVSYACSHSRCGADKQKSAAHICNNGHSNLDLYIHTTFHRSLWLSTCFSGTSTQKGPVLSRKWTQNFLAVSANRCTVMPPKAQSKLRWTKATTVYRHGKLSGAVTSCHRLGTHLHFRSTIIRPSCFCNKRPNDYKCSRGKSAFASELSSKEKLRVVTAAVFFFLLECLCWYK